MVPPGLDLQDVLHPGQSGHEVMPIVFTIAALLVVRLAEGAAMAKDVAVVLHNPILYIRHKDTAKLSSA
jgi:hypothetical protein